MTRQSAHCVRCGYDMRGHGAQAMCPECGWSHRVIGCSLPASRVCTTQNGAAGLIMFYALTLLPAWLAIAVDPPALETDTIVALGMLVVHSVGGVAVIGILVASLRRRRTGMIHFTETAIDFVGDDDRTETFPYHRFQRMDVTPTWSGIAFIVRRRGWEQFLLGDIALRTVAPRRAATTIKRFLETRKVGR